MEGLNLGPLLIGLGALIMGWVIGFFDSNNRSARKIRQAETKVGINSKEAGDRIAELETRLASRRATPAGADEAGLLRLMEGRNQILLDMDGERVDTAALSAAQRKRLIALITVMRPWLEGGTSGQSTARAPSTAPAGGPHAAAQPAGAAVQGRAGRALEQEVSAAPLSMVAQIDAILQARLSNTSLVDRGIRLQDSPEGSVIVYVGLERYQTIDDVTDGEVKAAIRAAVAEWEERFTPGI